MVILAEYFLIYLGYDIGQLKRSNMFYYHNSQYLQILRWALVLEELGIDSAAPDWTLTDWDGNSISLS